MQAEGRRQDTETAGPGHNGPPHISQAQFLKYLEEYDEVDAAVAEAVGGRKDLRTRIKGSGFNLKAFDRARQLAELSAEKREAEEREVRRNLAWMGKPLGHQAEMFPEEEADEPNGLDEAAYTAHQVRQIEAKGFAAGKAGHDRNGSNTWNVGSYAYQLFDSAWMRGQEVLAQSLAPSEPKRRPGRPKGTKNKPRVEAEA